MPTTTPRRRLLLVLVVVGAVAAGCLLWLLYRTPDRTDLATYWQLVVAVLALFLALVPLSRRSRGAAADHADGGSPDRLLAAADRLADAVRVQWEDAAADQQLLRPRAMPVRWSFAPLITSPAAVAAVGGAGAGPTEPTAVPGYEPVDEARLRQGGDVRELHGIVAGSRSGRLVISGAPGSGKSAAAALLLVDLVHHRARLTETERAGVPVPVLFTLAGFDPRAPLRDWLVHQLQRTYGPLFSGRRGGRTARELVDRGMIAPILDGLDEIPEALRRDAVTVLNETLSTRVVVTARSDELVGVIRDQYLHDAVAVVLEPVGADGAATYLAGTRPVGLSAEWEDLVDRVRSAPDGPLARALDNPLTIGLVRDGLRTTEDVGRFLALCAVPDVDQRTLEDHLLDQLVDTAYRARPARPAPRYDVETARRTLGWLAARLERDRTSDLAWWRLPNWVSRLPPALAVGAMTALAMFGVDVTGLAAWNALSPVLVLLAGSAAALGAWCAAGDESVPPVRWTDALGRPGLAFGYGVAVGVLSLGGVVMRVGDAAVVMIGSSVVVGGVLTGWSWWSGDARRGGRLEPVRVFVLGLGLGWTGILLVGSVVGVVPLMLVYLAVSLLSAGLALRLGLAHPTGPGPATASAPPESWRRRRWTELLGWFCLAFPCGTLALSAGLLLSTVVWEYGVLTLGLAALCGAALGLVFPESWLTWFACVQLAIRHRLPWHLARFLDDARARTVLRAVGPVYRFRHVALQRRLARSGPARRPLFSREVEDRALAWVERRACTAVVDRDRCRVAWWRVPAWAPRGPRVLAIAVLAGVVIWLGLGVLYPSLWLTRPGALIGLAAALGAAVGVRRLDRMLVTVDRAPRRPLSTLRRPAVVGGAVGLGFALELVSVQPAYSVGLALGVLVGAGLWLAVGVVVYRGRGGAARQRWRDITNDRPLFSGVLLGVAVGHLGLTVALSLLPTDVPLVRSLQMVAVLHLALSLLVVAVGLRISLRAAATTPSDEVTGDPFGSWRHHRRRQLAVWLLGGALVGAFVVRSGVRVVALTLPDEGTGSAVVMLAVALVLALAGGLLLGLLFPPTWLTSLACVQLRLGHPVPVRLVRLLEDARERDAVRADGPWFAFPRAPEPDARALSARPGP